MTGKIILISFADDEDKIMHAILSVLNSNVKVLRVDTVPFLSIIKYKELEICLEKREVKKNGQIVELTFTEFEILQLLVHNPGIVFSKEQIYNIVWKEPSSGDDSIVANHIRHIRKRIEDNAAKPVYIQTVWGVGYRFNPKISSG